MKTYRIHELSGGTSQAFASVKARTPMAALRKARKIGSKVTSAAYNGWTGEVEWVASTDDFPGWLARMTVRVTKRGTFAV